MASLMLLICKAEGVPICWFTPPCPQLLGCTGFRSGAGNAILVSHEGGRDTGTQTIMPAPSPVCTGRKLEPGMESGLQRRCWAQDASWHPHPDAVLLSLLIATPLELLKVCLLFSLCELVWWMVAVGAREVAGALAGAEGSVAGVTAGRALAAWVQPLRGARPWAPRCPGQAGWWGLELRGWDCPAQTSPDSERGHPGPPGSERVRRG